MPTATYIALQNTTLGSSAASVTFSSIPATYRDLVIVVNGRTTTTATNGQWIVAEFNSDTGANYSVVTMEAGGGATTIRSLSLTNGYVGKMNTSSSSNTDFSTSLIHIMDYSATDKHKTVLGRSSGKDGALDFAVSALATRWASTNAVNQVKLSLDTNSFASGSTFALYGIVS
jgi:hypothetical protein